MSKELKIKWGPTIAGFGCIAIALYAAYNINIYLFWGGLVLVSLVLGLFLTDVGIQEIRTEESDKNE